MNLLGGCLASFMIGCAFAGLKLLVDIVTRVLRILNPRRALITLAALTIVFFIWRGMKGVKLPEDPKQLALYAIVGLAAVVYLASRRGQLARVVAPLREAAGMQQHAGTARSVLRRELQRRGLLYDYAEHILEFKLETSPGDYYHVEMRGRDIVGSVEDGDIVEVSGRVDAQNVLRASKIMNESRHCVVVTRWA